MTFVFFSAEDFWLVFGALPEDIKKFAFASPLHKAIAVGIGSHVQAIKDICVEHRINCSWA